MKAWEYDCVVYEDDYHCWNCMPDIQDLNVDDYEPVFASDELDYYPTCCVCGYEHTYMNLTSYGYKQLEVEDYVMKEAQRGIRE